MKNCIIGFCRSNLYTILVFIIFTVVYFMYFAESFEFYQECMLVNFMLPMKTTLSVLSVLPSQFYLQI